MSPPPEPPPLASIETADALYDRVVHRGRRLRRERRAFLATAALSFMLLAVAVPIALTNGDDAQVATTGGPRDTRRAPTTTQTTEHVYPPYVEPTTSVVPTAVEGVTVTTVHRAPAKSTVTTRRPASAPATTSAPRRAGSPAATTTTTAVPASAAKSACQPRRSVAVNRAQILFVRGGNVFITTPGSPLQLTSAGGTQPAWSPDGTRFVYAGPDGLYTMPAAGGTPTRLTFVPGDSEPAWAPDGTLIAFVRNDNVFTIAPDAPGNDALVADAPDPLGGPTWAPDSCQMIFTWRGGLLRSQRDGSGIENLVGNVVQPSWSATGRVAGTRFIGSRRELVIGNADGSGFSQRSVGGATAPSWRGDGGAVAFAGPSRPTPGIYTQNEDGSGLAQVGGTTGGDTDPAW